jgi:protoporphyrinogen oxidase
MPPRWLLAVAREAVHNPQRQVAPASYADSLRSSFGPTVYDSIYEPFARKLWGLPGEQIDVEQARVRVTADSAAKVAARMARSTTTRLRARVGQGAAAPGGTRFYYPRHGFGQISEGLADAARKAGAEIHLGCEVVSLQAGDLVTARAGDDRSWQAPRVLSTLPIPVLARLVEPGPPDDVAAQARELRMRAMLLVYLTHWPSAPATGPVRWTEYDAHYLPCDSTPVSRISEPANYRANPDDPTDRSVICAELPCTVGDALWQAGDDDLARIVVAALADHDLPRVAVEGVQVRRVPAVYPVYDLGFADRLAALESWAEGLPGVTTFGRAGLFAHDNTHHAMVMAAAAADCLGPGGSFNEGRWARSRESFRSHVVED